MTVVPSLGKLCRYLRRFDSKDTFVEKGETDRPASGPSDANGQSADGDPITSA